MYDAKEAAEELKRIVGRGSIVSAVLSSPVKKGDDIGTKIKITKIQLKGEPCYQLSEFVGKKVLHTNRPLDGIEDEIISRMTGGYKQCSITADKYVTVLMNKKKQFTITGVKDNVDYADCAVSHNNTKNYILKNGEYVDWMHKLGLIDKNGIVANHMQKKFRQINKFVEMMQTVEKDLPQNAVIVDFGCGKSYLTFAMYHYFNTIKHKNVTIRGYDLKADVVEKCNKLADEFGFDKLHFYAEDIADVSNENDEISMIITLHACDTATDIAMYHGIRWGCKIIMNVPCCQHEVFHQIKNDNMSVILNYGLFKERFSAILTDAVRARILELKGYKVDVLEFIDMEHTPKNIMLRSVKKENTKMNKADFDDLKKLIAEYHINPTLYRLVFGSEGE